MHNQTQKTRTMKTKYIAIASSAILALASCAQNEEFSGTGNAGQKSQTIDFGQTFVGKTSRVASGDIENTEALKGYKVKVWGEMYAPGQYAQQTEKVFDGEVLHWDADATTIDGTDKKGKWLYDSEQRTWNESMDYDFVGFAPADASCSVKYENGKFTLSGIPAAQAIENGETKSGEDLLLSTVYTSQNTHKEREAISLSFKHILSRLSVYAYTTLGAGYEVDLKDMEIYLPASKAKASYQQTEHKPATAETGTTALPAGTWTWSDFDNVTNAANASALGDNYQAYTILSADGTAQKIYDGDEKTQATNLNHNFFLAPTETINLYAHVKYTIKGLKKGEDGNYTDEAYDSKDYDRFVPITALTAFKQGYQHNLYMLVSPHRILFNAEGVEGWDTGKDGNNNFIDNDGNSFKVSNLQNDETKHQVTGVIDNYGNLKVGSSDADVTYQLANVSLKNGTFSKDSQAITILGWYSDAECTGEPASTPSLINRYAKFAWDYTKTSLEAGTYTFTFKNNMNDKAQSLTLSLGQYTYNPTSNGDGGLSNFEGVDM